ncbi:MAG: thiamine pyrophosphate-binding protein [Nanopusillaceae archaeon]
MPTFKPLSEDIRKKRAKALVDALVEIGVNFSTGVPCAIQKYIIREFERRKEIVHVPAVREGESIGIAAGASMAGRKVVIYMQNSGFLNSIHDISSLILTYKIPVIFLITWRGCPGEDAIQHLIDGRITLPILSLLGIKYYILTPEKIESLVKKANKIIEKEKCVALIVKRGVF